MKIQRRDDRNIRPRETAECFEEIALPVRMPLGHHGPVKRKQDTVKGALLKDGVTEQFCGKVIDIRRDGAGGSGVERKAGTSSISSLAADT